ncbi:TPA: lipoate--protein ligase family protein [Candidatus Woesearchaeota archaeon]|nr:lipoate--protein ligase family protein [Candidatus Woesearchaeota archaeon]HII89228.1 lipoate--protein ligase family protein [Candidatus Woesearchaeota archaeon]
MNCIIHKVPNGKLLKVFLDVKEGRIDTIKITGDFFVHPEEAIEELEKHLCGVGIADIEQVVHAFFEQRDVEMVGLTEESLIQVLKDGSRT